MASHEQRAEALYREAESKLKAPTGFFALFSGGSNSRIEEAAELFSKAANLYKMAKQWDSAGNSYLRAAEAYTKADVKHEAATAFIDAGGSFKKINVEECIRCYRMGIDYYTDEGRFSIAAKYQKEIAEIYEQANDLEKAIESYMLAADYFEGEGASSSAGKCLLKVAEFAALIKNYDKAIELFDQVATTSLQNNLLRYSAKDYFLAATICRLAAGDVVSAKNGLSTYQEKDHTFGSTREFRFLQAIVEAAEENDAEAFRIAVVDYDRVFKIDKWKTIMLTRVREAIVEDEESLV